VVRPRLKLRRPDGAVAAAAPASRGGPDAWRPGGVAPDATATATATATRGSFARGSFARGFSAILAAAALVVAKAGLRANPASFGA
jgi:hypothetical protein